MHGREVSMVLQPILKLFCACNRSKYHADHADHAYPKR
jgi:hypothetical protein